MFEHLFGVLQALMQIRIDAMFFEQIELERFETTGLAYVSHSGHVRAENQLDVVLEKIDLCKGKKCCIMLQRLMPKTNAVIIPVLFRWLGGTRWHCWYESNC